MEPDSAGATVAGAGVVVPAFDVQPADDRASKMRQQTIALFFRHILSVMISTNDNFFIGY
jgi:hypothetical protein